MGESGITVTIRDREYRLVFTTAALKEVGRKYGGIEEMGARMDANQADAVDDICWLVALMANQGIMLDSGDLRPNNPELLTADMVGLYTRPTQLEQLSQAAVQAIQIGMGMEHKEGDSGPVDVILEDLRREEKKTEESPAE